MNEIYYDDALACFVSIVNDVLEKMYWREMFFFVMHKEN